MEEIQRKSEKILGSKNYKNNNFNNKEVRGESPIRKPAPLSNNKPIRLQSRNSTVQMNTSSSNLQNSSSQSKRNGGHATVIFVVFFKIFLLTLGSLI